jgi:hypothetical protein
MADAKLSALTELAATPAVDDELYIRDVSEAAADESKRITVANLMAAVGSSCVLNLNGQEGTGSTISDISGQNNHGTITGCLDGSTMVYTPQGAIPISKIKSGVDTFAYDNGLSVQKITGDTYSGNRRVYEVSTPTRSIKATDNHPFLTAVFNGQKRNSGYRNGHPYSYNSNDWSLQWLPLEQLQEGMAIVTAHHLPSNATQYPSIDMMKLIGCILGDGYFGRDGIGLCLVRKDEQEKYSQILDRLGIGHWVKDTEIKIYNKQLASYFAKELGLEGNAYTKHFPSWVWGLPTSHKKALLEGLIDSDGWLIRRDGVLYGYGIELANERLVSEIKALCGYIGLRTSNIMARERKEHPLKGRMLPITHSWTLQIYPNSGRNSRVRALTYGIRRRVNVPLSPEFQFETISSIKGIGQRDTYDISVADNPNFIANGMVVHNSTWVRLPSGLWVNSFDGTDDYITINNSSSLNPGIGNFSLGFWMNRTTNFSNYANFIGKLNTEGFVIPTENATLYFAARGANDGSMVDFVTYRPTSTNSLPALCYWVISRVGTALTLTTYLNGNLIGAQTETVDGSLTNTGDLKIGHNVAFGGGGTTIGLIKYDNRALSAAEISAKYNEEKHLFAPTIAPGEIRTASGSLTGGAANAILFAWHNPEAQDIFIKKVVINITTLDADAANIDCGIADNATYTNGGTEFFNDLPGETAALDDSYIAGDGGTQTKYVLCQDSASATDGWVVAKILDNDGTSIVGSYYIEYVGK